MNSHFRVWTKKWVTFLYANAMKATVLISSIWQQLIRHCIVYKFQVVSFCTLFRMQKPYTYKWIWTYWSNHSLQWMWGTERSLLHNTAYVSRKIPLVQLCLTMSVLPAYRWATFSSTETTINLELDLELAIFLSLRL